MSKIADALKKNDRKNNKGIFKSYSDKNINYNFLIALITVVFMAAMVSLWFRNNKKLIANKKFDYPPVAQLEANLNNKIRLLNKKVHDDVEEELNLLLVQNKLDKLYEKAKSVNNLKYQGIYFFKKNDYENSEKLFRKLIADNKADDVVISYLSAIYLNKNRYDYALNVLNLSKSDSSSLEYDRAVIYEKSGDIENAVKYYNECLKGLTDPLLLYKIKIKLFILKNLLVKNS